MTNETASDKKASGEAIAARWRHGSLWVKVVLVLSPVVFGMAYLIVNREALRSTHGDVFVGLLLGATYVLVEGLRLMHAYVVHRAPAFFAKAARPGEDEEAERAAQAFIRATFSDRRMLTGGLIYGLLVATAAALIARGESGSPLIEVLLWLFLFAVNYVAGMGFTGLVYLFRALWESREYLVVTVWRRSNESTRFVDDIRVRSAALAAVYVGLSLSSIVYFPSLAHSGLVTVYSLMATVVILVALIGPGMVIRSRLEDARGEAMNKVDAQLQAEFGALFPAGEVEPIRERLEKIDGLLALRDKIEGMAPPPLSWRTLRTAVGSVAMTVLSMILDKSLSPIVDAINGLATLLPH